MNARCRPPAIFEAAAKIVGSELVGISPGKSMILQRPHDAALVQDKLQHLENEALAGGLGSYENDKVAQRNRYVLQLGKFLNYKVHAWNDTRLSRTIEFSSARPTGQWRGAIR